MIFMAKGSSINPLPNLFEDVGADLVEAMYICFPFCCATCHSTSLLAALDRGEFVIGCTEIQNEFYG